MEGVDMMKARSRSNPFETIRKGIFQNRAAMKMANIDATFDFMFTNPVDMEGVNKCFIYIRQVKDTALFEYIILLLISFSGTDGER